MSQYFKMRGLDVGHEVMGADGTSDWRLVANGSRGYANPDEIVIHAIRHPVNTITSMYLTTSDESKQFMWDLCGADDESRFERVCATYGAWHRMIRERWVPDFDVRVEVKSDFTKLNELTGSDIMPENDVNSRGHGDVAQEKWDQLTCELKVTICNYCYLYYGGDCLGKI